MLSTAKSTFGTDAETWALQKEVYASVTYTQGNEQSTGDGFVSESIVDFRFDYISGLSPKTNRIRFNNQIYDILYVSELGYRDAIRCTCRAQAIAGVGEGISGSSHQIIPATFSRLVGQTTINIAEVANAPLSDPVVIVSYAQYAATLAGLYNLKTSAGTVTVSIYINGVAVTGLAGLSVTDSAQHPAATANNSISVGDRIVMVLADNAAAEDLECTMRLEVSQ